MMVRITVTAVIISIAAALWADHLWRSNKTLRLENDTLSRSIVSLRVERAQAQLARDVERARAQRIAARRVATDAAIETILTGDIQDAPLDPRLADLVNGMQQANR